MVNKKSPFSTQAPSLLNDAPARGSVPADARLASVMKQIGAFEDILESATMLFIEDQAAIIKMLFASQPDSAIKQYYQARYDLQGYQNNIHTDTPQQETLSALQQRFDHALKMNATTPLSRDVRTYLHLHAAMTIPRDNKGNVVLNLPQGKLKASEQKTLLTLEKSFPPAIALAATQPSLTDAKKLSKHSAAAEKGYTKSLEYLGLRYIQHTIDGVKGKTTFPFPQGMTINVGEQHREKDKDGNYLGVQEIGVLSQAFHLISESTNLATMDTSARLLSEIALLLPSQPERSKKRTAQMIQLEQLTDAAQEINPIETTRKAITEILGCSSKLEATSLRQSLANKVQRSHVNLQVQQQSEKKLLTLLTNIQATVIQEKSRLRRTSRKISRRSTRSDDLQSESSSVSYSQDSPAQQYRKKKNKE